MASTTSPAITIAKGYRLQLGFPPLAEYRRLRADSGLSPVTAEQAAPVATGSWFGCYIVHEETSTAAAMGRIISEGGWYFIIADMATLPEHQRKGLGSVIMQTLLARIKETAPPNAYVTLIADPPGLKLYEKYGFIDCARATKHPEKVNLVEQRAMFKICPMSPACWKFIRRVQAALDDRDIRRRSNRISETITSPLESSRGSCATFKP